MFSIGLKGIDAADADKVERLIIDTISASPTTGLILRPWKRRSTPSNFICAKTTPAHSRAASCSCCARCCVPGLHGRDPLSPLAFEAPLAAIKAAVAAGERYSRT